jgi:hypothetical protein
MEKTAMTPLLTLALAAVIDTGLSLVDATGVARRPLAAPAGGVAVVLLVSHDCPISNRYGPEVGRICAAYESRGVSCRLVYVDTSLADADALTHAREHGHGDYAVFVDREHTLVRALDARIAPEAVVLDGRGAIAYRGRIDDQAVAWGVSRRQVRTHDLRDALDALVAGRPPAVPRTQPVGCFIAAPSGIDR